MPIPIYFDVYRPHLNKTETPYALRPHPLPVPQVAHVYAEASLVYKLVSMKNKILQYRSASLSINPASRAGACTDCEYIECTIAMIIIVILVRSLFLVY